MPERKSKLGPTNLFVRESVVHGRGAFADTVFLEGDWILDIDDSDPVLDRSKLSPEQAIFIDVFVAVDGTVKTTWMKSPERFINHSCEPNSYVLTDMKTGVRRTWALQNIRQGDEVTWDYALNIWEAWVRPVPCNCGAEKCLRVIRGNYFTLPRAVQRKYLPLLDEPFKKRFSREIRLLDLRTQP
jgi:hypothetical protein